MIYVKSNYHLLGCCLSCPVLCPSTSSVNSLQFKRFLMTQLSETLSQRYFVTYYLHNTLLSSAFFLCFLPLQCQPSHTLVLLFFPILSYHVLSMLPIIHPFLIHYLSIPFHSIPFPCLTNPFTISSVYAST